MSYLRWVALLIQSTISIVALALATTPTCLLRTRLHAYYMLICFQGRECGEASMDMAGLQVGPREDNTVELRGQGTEARSIPCYYRQRCVWWRELRYVQYTRVQSGTHHLEL